MNHKGFTLVELLVVIVLIGLIGSIAAVAYNSFQQSAIDRLFKSYMDNMHAAAIMYYTDHPAEQPKQNQSKRIMLSELDLENIKNPVKSGDNCFGSGSYVDAEWINDASNKGMSGIKYTVHLKCGDYLNKLEVYIN